MSAIPLIGPLIEGVTSFFTKREERKATTEVLKGELAKAAQTDETQISLKRADAQIAARALQNNSWKDEYGVIITTWFIPTLIIGIFYKAFTGDSAVVDATLEAIAALNAAGIPVGDLALAGVLFSFGIITLKKW